MNGRVEIKKFEQVDLQDVFFDSFKSDYKEFEDWFNGKAAQDTYVIYSEEGKLNGFLYLKFEAVDEADQTIEPSLPSLSRVKIGTMKVAESGQGNKFGEGLLKIAFDVARQSQAGYIYVTVFPKYEELIGLLIPFGFKKHGTKTTPNGVEDVYIRHLAKIYDHNHPSDNYPFIPRNPENAVRIVPIEAEYHSLLFPASDLQGAKHQIDNHIPASNAIRKMYLTKGDNTNSVTTGDILFFYRIKHPDEVGQKMYKSAITTVSIVEKVYREGIDYHGLGEYSKIAGSRTAFTHQELGFQYNRMRRNVIIQFLYVLSFGKGHNVNLRTLVDHQIITLGGDYWGFLPISNEKYQIILREAGINGDYFID